MRIRLISILILGATTAFLANPSTAAPNCNEQAFGKCMQCKSWLSMPNWKQQACYISTNPQVRFPCSALKCGPFPRDTKTK